MGFVEAWKNAVRDARNRRACGMKHLYIDIELLLAANDILEGRKTKREVDASEKLSLVGRDSIDALDI